MQGLQIENIKLNRNRRQQKHKGALKPKFKHFNQENNKTSSHALKENNLSIKTKRIEQQK